MRGKPKSFLFDGLGFPVIINTIKTRLNQVATTPDMGEFNALIIDTTPATSNPETDLQTSLILDNLNEEARLYVEGYNY